MVTSLDKAMVFSIVSAVCFWIAYQAKESGVNAVVIFTVILGCAFGFGACAYGLDWLVDTYATRAQQMREVQIMSSATEALRIIKDLSPQAQLELATKFETLGFSFVGMLGRMGDQNMVTFSLDDQNGKIPFWFIDKFMKLSDHRVLANINQWGDGTKERKWGIALTKKFAMMDLCEVASRGKRTAWKIKSGNRSGYFIVIDTFWGEDHWRDMDNKKIESEYGAMA